LLDFGSKHVAAPNLYFLSYRDHQGAQAWTKNWSMGALPPPNANLPSSALSILMASSLKYRQVGGMHTQRTADGTNHSRCLCNGLFCNALCYALPTLDALLDVFQQVNPNSNLWTFVFAPFIFIGLGMVCKNWIQIILPIASFKLCIGFFTARMYLCFKRNQTVPSSRQQMEAFNLLENSQALIKNLTSHIGHR
jgi:hypothetical protein